MVTFRLPRGLALQNTRARIAFEWIIELISFHSNDLITQMIRMSQITRINWHPFDTRLQGSVGVNVVSENAKTARNSAHSIVEILYESGALPLSYIGGKLFGF